MSPAAGISARSATASAVSHHVSLVAIPDAVISTLAGIFDTMNAHSLMDPGRVGRSFDVEIVGETPGPLWLASGVPIQVQRSIDTLESSDIVIVPSVLLRGNAWHKGRYPRLVDWLASLHAKGAVLCSACSGIFLIAETGVFDGRDSTVHYAYADAFARAYPAVTIHPERVLVISGTREELVSSGASSTWHDMALYLIARFAGATDAQDIARMYALQWHQDGLAPYISFVGRTDHGDAEIVAAQRWLAKHFSMANPVEEMIRRSRLAERTLKRRFVAATGLTPIDYVQRLRIEDAKRRLERTGAPVDEIAWRVGYEDPASFRRLFKRTTGVTPGTYRRRFSIPDFARRPA